jgi:hypothetical protein
MKWCAAFPTTAVEKDQSIQASTFTFLNVATGRISTYGRDDAVQCEDLNGRFKRNCVQSPTRLSNRREAYSANRYATKSGARMHLSGN